MLRKFGGDTRLWGRVLKDQCRLQGLDRDVIQKKKKTKRGQVNRNKHNALNVKTQNLQQNQAGKLLAQQENCRNGLMICCHLKKMAKVLWYLLTGASDVKQNLELLHPVCQHQISSGALHLLLSTTVLEAATTDKIQSNPEHHSQHVT